MIRLSFSKFLTLSFIVLSSTAFAQVSFGVKAGADLYKFHADNVPGGIYVTSDSKPKLGYFFGVFSKIGLSKKFAIIPELQYIVKGDKEKISSGTNNSSNQTTNVSYVEVPIMLYYSLIKRLGIEVGPVVGVKLSPAIDVYEPLELGIAGGLRVDLPGRFSIGARYNLGLTKVASAFITTDGVTGTDVNWYNRGGQLSVYYTILGKK